MMRKPLGRGLDALIGNPAAGIETGRRRLAIQDGARRQYHCGGVSAADKFRQGAAGRTYPRDSEPGGLSSR